MQVPHFAQRNPQDLLCAGGRRGELPGTVVYNSKTSILKNKKIVWEFDIYFLFQCIARNGRDEANSVGQLYLGGKMMLSKKIGFPEKLPIIYIKTFPFSAPTFLVRLCLSFHRRRPTRCFPHSISSLPPPPLPTKTARTVLNFINGGGWRRVWKGGEGRSGLGGKGGEFTKKIWKMRGEMPDLLLIG